jgi:Glutaredoxin.
MKKITMFMFAACPYCKKAIDIQQKLLRQEKYSGVEIEMIDEKKHPDIANRYDYFYVPTYYVDGKKLHEGAADEENVKAVLDAAAEG